MATGKVSNAATASSSGEALHHLKELLQHDSAFAEALRATDSTEAAARVAADHGVNVTPEALWRNRGTLISSGLPTWRG